MLLRRPLLTDLLMIAALFALGVAGYRYSSLLAPKADITVPAPACDLNREACGAVLPGGGRLEFAITPRPVPALDDLRLDVRLAGLPARRVEVDFTGKTMNMGLNRVELAPGPAGVFSGKAALAVCVTGGMTWIATVHIETDSQRIAIPFSVDVGR